jgi:hypothetical protein
MNRVNGPFDARAEGGLMRKFFATGLWVDKHLAAWVTVIVIMVNISLAMTIISGGIRRFSIPSYSPLISYTHGEIWIWGVWILVSAVLTSVPFRWPNIIGLWLSMFWHVIWMACFIIAGLRYENAAATPTPLHAGMAMVSVALLAARVFDREE